MLGSSDNVQNNVNTTLLNTKSIRNKIYETEIQELSKLFRLYDKLENTEENLNCIQELLERQENYRVSGKDNISFICHINSFYDTSDKTDQVFIERIIKFFRDIKNCIPISRKDNFLYLNNKKWIINTKFSDQIFEVIIPNYITKADKIIKKSESVLATLNSKKSVSELSNKKIYFFMLITIAANFLITTAGIYWVYNQKNT